MSACAGCRRRMWLLQSLAPRLERQRAQIERLLAHSDLGLIAALGGQQTEHLTQSYLSGPGDEAHGACAAACAPGIALVCRHEDSYPNALRALQELAPAALSVNGGVDRLRTLTERPAVAIVGTRRATPYGLAVARQMARDLTGAGATVVSGMAYGIDGAAHEGALAAGGATLAVLAGTPGRAYPVRKSRLFEQILERGAVISELGPEAATWRWALQARNRIIAGLAEVTVVVEAPLRSGALITVRHSGRLGRWIAAVPGPVNQVQSAGPNQLLAKPGTGGGTFDVSRVRAVRDAQDVLDLIHGDGQVTVQADQRPAPSASEAALLDRISGGLDNVTKIEVGMLADLSALELKGWLARGPGGALVRLTG